MYEQDSLEKAQKRRITFLEEENSHLTKINDVLRAALTHQTIEAENTFRDNIDKFNVLSRQVWAVLADLNKVWRRPATYDEIVKSFQTKYPKVACGETICRRVRELVENNWVESPRRGMFIVVKNPNP